MSITLELRSWQSKFVRQLSAHRSDDFLLVACPAAGKTIGAAAGAASVMEARDCNQLVVVCPTVVVRDQWANELGRLGYRMLTSFERGGWPEHVHGVCTTYAQVAQRAERFAAACANRRTVVVFDEIHHAGLQLSWGAAIADGFREAQMRLMLSGTPFRSDRDRIPFLRYAPDGTCRPDFAYDYPRAVRDGVCRSIEFRAHDGVITWQEDDAQRTASFSDQIDAPARAKRLRASLDPRQPYLAALLADAHDDLLQLREKVPDAAGLVVCDSQAHALEVDRLLTEITGHVPVLAMSDVPRAHQAIAAFATEDVEWLVSVRMVAEGVDIPRLGVIAWATTARTELMVRQVAGRALRGRGDHAALPAIVHMPADPQLAEYAGRLDVLGGVSLAERRGDGHRAPRVVDHAAHVRGIDPTPFVKWFDRMAEGLGAAVVISRCGWSYDTGLRMLYRWRNEGCNADILTLYDACHMAGVDFDTMFEGDEYAAAREFVHDPGDSGGGRQALRAVDAQPTTAEPIAITPPLPAGRLHAAPEPVEIATPDLPPSPEEIRAAEQARDTARAQIYSQLVIYAQLQRAVNPAYQLATAQRELVAAVGVVRPDSPDEQVAEALEWIRQQTRALALLHPEHLKQLARTRRRLAQAV